MKLDKESIDVEQVGHKDAKHMITRMKVMTTVTFCGGYSGAIVPDDRRDYAMTERRTSEKKLLGPSLFGKNNQVYTEPDVGSDDYLDQDLSRRDIKLLSRRNSQ